MTQASVAALVSLVGLGIETAYTSACLWGTAATDV
jgi:hypothetical protein